MVISSNSTT